MDDKNKPGDIVSASKLQMNFDLEIYGGVRQESSEADRKFRKIVAGNRVEFEFLTLLDKQLGNHLNIVKHWRSPTPKEALQEEDEYNTEMVAAGTPEKQVNHERIQHTWYNEGLYEETGWIVGVQNSLNYLQNEERIEWMAGNVFRSVLLRTMRGVREESLFKGQNVISPVQGLADNKDWIEDEELDLLRTRIPSDALANIEFSNRLALEGVEKIKKTGMTGYSVFGTNLDEVVGLFTSTYPTWVK